MSTIETRNPPVKFDESVNFSRYGFGSLTEVRAPEKQDVRAGTKTTGLESAVFAAAEIKFTR